MEALAKCVRVGHDEYELPIAGYVPLDGSHVLGRRCSQRYWHLRPRLEVLKVDDDLRKLGEDRADCGDSGDDEYLSPPGGVGNGVFDLKQHPVLVGKKIDPCWVKRMTMITYDMLGDKLMT